jgi:cytochrome c oxidase subunit 2
VAKGQTGQAKGAAIPNPVGEPGNTGNPDAPAVVQGGTR